MSFFGSLFEKKVADASALTWTELLGGPTSKSGVTVNEDRVLRMSVAFACCRVVCEDIGKLH